MYIVYNDLYEICVLFGELKGIKLALLLVQDPPGQSDIPSIAAVVSSRQWPLKYKYRAFVRTQSQRVEMLDSLSKRVSDTGDEGPY
jgi:eukaryotic translation initiation factor 2C